MTKFNARLLPTRDQATVYYMTCTQPALLRWRNLWRSRLLEAPVMISERQWHISEINRILSLHPTQRGPNVQQSSRM